MKNENYIGSRFGDLVVTEVHNIDGASHVKFTCKCDCGKYHTARKSDIIRGHTTSCGHISNPRGLPRRIQKKRIKKNIPVQTIITNGQKPEPFTEWNDTHKKFQAMVKVGSQEYGLGFYFVEEIALMAAERRAEAMEKANAT